jgi:L-amino acid N-acyltransferase YncA
MRIRHYQPGDERAQTEIYNQVASALPAFKPATAEEVARRYRTSDADPASKFYLVEDSEVVGYAVLNPNGRISYPWCLPRAAGARVELLQAVLDGLKQRGCRTAWATYRADWRPILDFFAQAGFRHERDMINYAGPRQRLPETLPSEAEAIAPLHANDVPLLQVLGGPLFQDLKMQDLVAFYLRNPYFQPESLFTIKRSGDGRVLGFGVAIVNAQYADPARLDAAMPCFRLGAVGTETERHKRVNGLVSCLFDSERIGELALAEASRRFAQAGITTVAAQAASDQPMTCALYDRYLQRQGTFPILVKVL